MRNRGAANQVFQWLEKNSGLTCYLSDMAEGLQLEKGAVQNAVRYLMNDKGLPIEAVIGGHSWRYTPNKAVKRSDSGSLFEKIATLKSGDLVLQDEEGTLYRAQALS